MAAKVFVGCTVMLLVSVLVISLPDAKAPVSQDYLAYHDSIGKAMRVYDGSSNTYYKYSGDPVLQKEEQPGDLPNYESRGFWRFTIPDFTGKNVKDVKLEFRTRNAFCQPPPTCDGALSFKVDVFRLYEEPVAATAQAIFDGVHAYKGLPLLKGSLAELVLTAQAYYSTSLGPNAVADISHHEGGWYAIGMKVYDIRDASNNPVWGWIEVCSLPNCAVPQSKPGSGTFSQKPRPGPLYAIPVLKVTYEEATIWSELHGDARHNGYSASASPATGNNVWRADYCNPPPPPLLCEETAYSPVAKDGFVYIATMKLPAAVPYHKMIHAYTYQGLLFMRKEVPATTSADGGHGGQQSLAVSNDLLVLTTYTQPGPSSAWRTSVHAFKPASDLTDPLGSLWTYIQSPETSTAGRG